MCFLAMFIPPKLTLSLGGYKYNAGGRCITVFSCSHYCQGVNDAAIAYVQDCQIRVIQVDTGLDN